MDKIIFEKKLVQHKKIISSLFNTKNKLMVIPARKTAEELALAYAECKCEKCKKETNLQYHHLIQRPFKPFMDYWKYFTQRYYWSNILILCRDCHAEIENRKPMETGTISQKMIDKIKKKYTI